MREWAEVGIHFTRRRKELSLTQSEAANAARVSLSTWQTLERNGGVAQPSWRAAAIALEWPMDAAEQFRRGVDVAELGSTAATSVGQAEALQEIERLMHLSGLDAQAVEMGMALVRRLYEFDP